MTKLEELDHELEIALLDILAALEHAEREQEQEDEDGK